MAKIAIQTESGAVEIEGDFSPKELRKQAVRAVLALPQIDGDGEKPRFGFNLDDVEVVSNTSVESELAPEYEDEEGVDE